jgi:hypothetical protein
MWVRGICPRGNQNERKFSCPKRHNVLPLKSTGPSNSTQQWGLKSPEETLVKDEVIGYNEG